MGSSGDLLLDRNAEIGTPKLPQALRMETTEAVIIPGFRPIVDTEAKMEENEIKVKGCCPSCGCRNLALYTDVNEIVCKSKYCDDPYALHKIIQDDEIEHVVFIGAKDFSMQHPLKERVNRELLHCEQGEWLFSQSGPPVEPGKYRMRRTLDDDEETGPYVFKRIGD